MIITTERLAVTRALPQILARRQGGQGQRPKDDEALLGWIAEVTGCLIPDAAVCPGHDAPAAVVCDLFSHRVTDALVLASRGGGKTFDIAALHLANARWKPGHETSHIGAIDPQARRAYGYYLRGLMAPALRDMAPNPHIRETRWVNGSWIEILPGTEAQTQGGHPMLVTYDELESGKYQPYENAKAMPAEWQDNGYWRLGQFLAASTRVTSLGLMQRALDEAVVKGTKVYTWCVWETIQPCQEECTENGCWIYEQTGGRSRNATGWRSHEDILSHYQRVGRDTWDAQYLCLKPEAKALIYAPFGPANITPEADYVPGAGELWLSYDWGYTDPTHICLMQYRDGVFNVFDELVGSQRSEREWVEEIVRRVCDLPGYNGPTLELEATPQPMPYGWRRRQAWREIWASRQEWPKPWATPWPEAAGDPSAVQFRAELKEHGMGAASAEKVRHEVEKGQDVLRAAILSGVDSRRLRVHPRCVKTIACFSNYRARPLADGTYDPRPDPDPANHAYSHGCDSLRYLVWRLRRYLGLGGVKDGDST